MIYGNSNDPILIKKIALRIWSLRDELESVIRMRMAKDPGNKVDISDLVKEYKYNGPPPKEGESSDGQNLKLVEGEENQEEASSEVQDKAQSDDAGDNEVQASEEEVENPEDTAGESEETQKDQSSETNKKDVVYLRKLNIPENKIFHATSILSEINMSGMYFFCNKEFLEGQSIVIELLVPKRFILNADVVYCRPYNMKSRIISESKLPYRVAAKFTFLKEGERTLLRQFIKSIEPEIPPEPVKSPKAKESSEDDDLGGDDFDDLDDLDL